MFAVTMTTRFRTMMSIELPKKLSKCSAISAQQSFADALERQARVHRLPSPRIVKAGLLAALLCGESSTARWLVASVMPMSELSALATEANPMERAAELVMEVLQEVISGQKDAAAHV